MGLSVFEGLKIFSRNRFLKYTLIFTAISWILIDLGIIFGNFVLSQLWISFCIIIIHLLFILVLLAVFGFSEKWTGKRIVLVLIILSPFYFLTLLLMVQYGLGMILLLSEVIINTLLAQWFCINIGSYIQEKSKNKASLSIGIYFFGAIFGLFLYNTLINNFNPPSNYAGIWGSLSIVRVIYIGFFVIGLIIGLIRKQIPIALGPYYLISFFYFYYLFMRSFLLNQGYSSTDITLMSIPMNIFLFIYACGKISYNFFIKRGDKEPSPKVQASLVYFMLVQIGVHVSIIISQNNPANQITTDIIIAFMAVALFLLFTLIIGGYILMKFSKSEKTP
jgi:hypothetical protein